MERLDVESAGTATEEPEDFRRALDADPCAAAAWQRLPPSHRREHVRAIEEAKRPETRKRRIDRALEMLRG